MKGAFLLLLTPVMLKHWGADNYGIFALSASLLVSMGLLDGGVRALTRIRLSRALAEGDEEGFWHLLGSGLVAFSVVCLVATVVAFLLSQTGFLTGILRLPRSGGMTLAITVALTALLMIGNLMLEPLAARGNLSAIKSANTIGALVSLPICWWAVVGGGSVRLTVVLSMVCVIAPNCVLALQHRIPQQIPWGKASLYHPISVMRTLRDGIWYYLTTVSLIVKGHGLTFLVSALAGPAEAGLFYIILRIAELIINVGTTASETTLSALAASTSLEQTRERFRQSWIYVSLICLHSGVTLSFLAVPIMDLWLRGKNDFSLIMGPAMALFGLAGGLSRVAVNASMGLALVREAALANLVEAALTLTFAIAGYKLGGLAGLLLLASAAVLVMLFPLRRISGRLELTVTQAYLQPLMPLLPGLIAALVIQFLASGSHFHSFWFAAVALAGLIAMWQLRGLHKKDT